MQEGSLWLPLVASGWTVIDMQSELACWDDSWNNKKSDALLIGSDCETYATESCCASTGFRLVELILTFCSYSYSTHNRTHTIFIPYSYLTTLTPCSYPAHTSLTSCSHHGDSVHRLDARHPSSILGEPGVLIDSAHRCGWLMGDHGGKRAEEHCLKICINQFIASDSSEPKLLDHSKTRSL